jgi:hypothetical protein
MAGKSASRTTTLPTVAASRSVRGDGGKRSAHRLGAAWPADSWTTALVAGASSGASAELSVSGSLMNHF